MCPADDHTCRPQLCPVEPGAFQKAWKACARLEGARVDVNARLWQAPVGHAGGVPLGASLTCRNHYIFVLMCTSDVACQAGSCWLSHVV